MEKFSKKEAIKFGWSAMKSNFWFFVKFLIIAGLIYIIPDIILALIKDPTISTLLVVRSFEWVLYLFLSIGLINIALRIYDEKKAELSDLFSQYRLFFYFLVTTILYNLIVLAGMILLIIPGIIWSIKFQFAFYFVVDRKLGPIQALRKSAEITQGAKWNLFILGILLALINLLGMLCLFVGLFATIPTMMMAMAFVYRKLLSQTEAIPVSASENPETSRI